MDTWKSRALAAAPKPQPLPRLDVLANMKRKAKTTEQLRRELGR